jgi:hypothetical protein
MVYISLRDAHKHLANGRNVLAIEAHTVEGGFDLCLDPSLVLED